MQFGREIIPLVVNIYLAKPNSSFTNRQIQKILFKLKQELPENEHLQRVLPYYWYTYGPFSETVANSITQMTRAERIRQVDADGVKLLELNRSKVAPANEALEPEIRDTLETILATHNVVSPQPLIDEVYTKYAPRKFLPLYTIEFLRALQQHVRTKKIEKILSLEDVLYECEAALPLEPFFERFNEQFSLFASYTSLLFDHARDTDSSNVSFSYTKLVAENLWRRFAKGVRILPDGHDEFYENKLASWLVRFKRENSEKLIPKIDEYSFHVVKSTAAEPYSRPALLVT
ncbi:MAG: hypothetical protein WBZ42_03535 [Halobacteriota archaeon]